MTCPKCKNEMKEEILFTSVTGYCNCEEGWLTSTEALNLAKDMDLPISVYVKDITGPQWAVIIHSKDYFSRSPKEYRFKFTSAFSDYYDI